MEFLDPGQISAILAVVAAILIASQRFIRSRFGICRSKTNLTGKTAIVTGANCGIGYYTALDFAKRNARVILACRNEAKAQEAKKKIIEESGNYNVHVGIVDVGCMASVRKFAQKINEEEQRLDILVNNAGILNSEKPTEITGEGFELMFATNHFGPFLLTNLLLDLMKKTSPSRIVMVSSMLNKYGQIDFDNLQGQKSFNHFKRYSDSKLANILFTRELARRLEGTGVTANALHPGAVSTQIYRKSGYFVREIVTSIARRFCKTSDEGAQTSIYLAVSEEVNGISGKYFSDCNLYEQGAHAISRDMDLASKLWDVSEKLTGLSTSRE